MTIKTLGSIIFFCVLLIVSKEFLFLNEEVLVIISFLTFITIAIKVGGESIGEELDKVSGEISMKVTVQKNKLLSELVSTRNEVKGVENIQGELDFVISHCVEDVEKLEKKVSEEKEQTISSLIEEQIYAEIERQLDEELEKMDEMVGEMFEEYEEKV